MDRFPLGEFLWTHWDTHRTFPKLKENHFSCQWVRNSSQRIITIWVANSSFRLLALMGLMMLPMAQICRRQTHLVRRYLSIESGSERWQPRIASSKKNNRTEEPTRRLRRQCQPRRKWGAKKWNKFVWSVSSENKLHDFPPFRCDLKPTHEKCSENKIKCENNTSVATTESENMRQIYLEKISERRLKCRELHLAGGENAYQMRDKFHSNGLVTCMCVRARVFKATRVDLSVDYYTLWCWCAWHLFASHSTSIATQSCYNNDFTTYLT